MSQHMIRASGSSSYLRAEVGPVDDDGRFLFGETAEVYGSIDWKTNTPEPSQVSMAAIGSHDLEMAMRRLKSYGAAIALAEQVDKRIAAGSDFEAIAEDLDGTPVQEVRLSDS